MIAHLRLAGVLPIVCLLAACQAAAPTSPVAPSAPSPERMEFITQFKNIDTANKGMITLDQAKAHYTEVFRRLDTNRDGFLSVAEIQPLMPVMAARSTDELVARLDRNGDNKLTLAEFLVINTWLFRLSRDPKSLTLDEVERGFSENTGPVKEPSLFGN